MLRKLNWSYPWIYGHRGLAMGELRSVEMRHINDFDASLNHRCLLLFSPSVLHDDILSIGGSIIFLITVADHLQLSSFHIHHPSSIQHSIIILCFPASIQKNSFLLIYPSETTLVFPAYAKICYCHAETKVPDSQVTTLNDQDSLQKTHHHNHL